MSFPRWATVNALRRLGTLLGPKGYQKQNIKLQSSKLPTQQSPSRAADSVGTGTKLSTEATKLASGFRQLVAIAPTISCLSAEATTRIIADCDRDVQESSMQGSGMG
jgi:hypothetical protein